MKLTFGNKEFELKDLTLNDWIGAEEMGLKLGNLSKLAQDPNALSLKDIRTLVYTVIHCADNTISPEWVGENLSLSNMKEVMEVVGNFITNNNQEIPTDS
jgi:hypothetical protein